MSFPERRLRRLRRTPALRRLVAETASRVDDLVAPLFVKEGIDAPEPIASMPGVVQHTQESLRKEVRALADLGVPGVILFGVPAHKDARGSQADAPDGIVQVALRDLRDEVGDALVLMADDCLDEYTDHGHCGISRATATVDNDATLERYASDRGRPGRRRRRRRRAERDDGRPGRRDPRRARRRPATPTTAILAYAAKYASRALRPVPRRGRRAIAAVGDRKGYQRTRRNAREALAEVALDIDEGADMVMVKPALAYLDVIAAVRAAFDVPVAAYHVSGEYAMVKAAAAARLDRRRRGRARAPARDQARRRRHHPHVLRARGRRAAAQRSREHERAGSSAAQARIPGGVNSPVRAFGSVGGKPFFVARARRRRTSSTPTARRYIDYVQSWGASILGHAHPAVVEAVQRGRGRRHVVRRADASARSSSPRRSASGCRRSRRCGWCRRAPRRR